MKLSASLVLFHSDPALYGPAIKCYLDGCDGVLYVVDNSAAPLQHELFRHSRVRYVFAGRNLGFGAAHNRALALLDWQSDAHLFLNPDIRFSPEVLPVLARRLAEDANIGAVMPRVEYPNGELQRLCKLLPTPIDLTLRRFIPSHVLRARINHRYELHDLPQDRRCDIPSLSGCFLLVRTTVLRALNGFDERYFMYLEDVDLVRRVGDCARTVYEPAVKVTHAYAKGSYYNKKLLGYHLKSAVLYFNKWGWFFDAARSRRNQETIRTIRATLSTEEAAASSRRPPTFQ